MSIVETLQNAAESFFNPETGSAEMLVDEFNTSPEFVRGHRRGLEDAYNILLGLADYVQDVEREAL